MKWALNEAFVTYRTGFVPSFFEGDLIQVYEHDFPEKTKTYRVIKITPVQFKALPEEVSVQEELKIYHRKFDDQQWFFKIELTIA
jgi:uncharacterized protein YqfB (UPF0267 family)